MNQGYATQPVMMGMPVVSPSSRFIPVTVPNGATGGSVLQIRDPQTGKQFIATVPQGLSAGMMFEMQVPVRGVYPSLPVQPINYNSPNQSECCCVPCCEGFFAGLFFCCFCCSSNERGYENDPNSMNFVFINSFLYRSIRGIDSFDTF